MQGLRRVPTRSLSSRVVWPQQRRRLQKLSEPELLNLRRISTEENLQFSNFGLERPRRSSEVIGGQLIRYRRDSLHFSSNGKFQNQTVTQNIINFINLNFCAKMFKSQLSKSICFQNNVKHHFYNSIFLKVIEHLTHFTKIIII